MWFGHTLFFAGLPFGRVIGWIGQVRDDHTVFVAVALQQLWPHTAVGIACLAILAATHPIAAIYAFVLIAGGLAVSIHSPSSQPCPASDSARAHRHRPAAGGKRTATGAGRTVASGCRGLRAGGLGPCWTRSAPRAASWRSFGVYYGRNSRSVEKDRLYAQFVKPGDLVFDVGAHVGDRVASFRRLGARVVAIEPQPALAFTLKTLYGRDRNVAIESKAVGRSDGTLTMMINVDNPTVSTMSSAFIDAARGAQGWEGQVWEKAIVVPVTTLDALIEAHASRRL